MKKILKILGIGLACIILYLGLRFLPGIFSFASTNGITPNVIKSLIFHTTEPLKTTNNRINIILLGIGGGNHESPLLTDSMLFVSLNPTTHDALVISIPRDIWIPSLNERINETYREGEEKKKGGGLILAKAEVEEVIGQPVHYAWVIDFAGFTKIVDTVGGVDIDVDTAFEDNEYPIAGKETDMCGGDQTYTCRYEHLHFDKGLQHMDGERALKYVRSRHAQGEEGSDFARSKRQQKVLLAIKEKVIQYDFWKHPKNLKQLYAAVDDATDTDMTLGEAAIFGQAFRALSPQQIRHIPLDTGDGTPQHPGLLTNPPLTKYNGAWVLEPTSGTFAEIHRYVTCEIESKNCKAESSPLNEPNGPGYKPAPANISL